MIRDMRHLGEVIQDGFVACSRIVAGVSEGAHSVRSQMIKQAQRVLNRYGIRLEAAYSVDGQLVARLSHENGEREIVYAGDMPRNRGGRPRKCYHFHRRGLRS